MIFILTHRDVYGAMTMHDNGCTARCSCGVSNYMRSEIETWVAMHESWPITVDLRLLMDITDGNGHERDEVWLAALSEWASSTFAVIG